MDTRHVEKSTYSRSLMWQKTESEGYINQTLHLPKIHGLAPGAGAYQGAGGVSVQLPAGSSVRTQIEALSGQPGLEYLGELGQRSDIDWKRVEVINQSLNINKQGLTPEGVIVVAIAVAIATAGTGAGLVGTTTATATGTVTTLGGVTLATTTAATATAAATATTFAAGAAISAGFTALATIAATSLINNGGDLGETIKELGRKDTLRAVAVSAATAGLTQGAMEMAKLAPMTGDAANAANAAEVAQRTADLGKVGTALARGTVQGLSAAMVESAILGTSFEEALGRHLTSSLIASLGAVGAKEIGTHFDKTDALGKLNHKIAHAVLGCAMGAASADSSAGCAPGAVGAVIGELVAEWYGEASGYKDLERQSEVETDPIKRQALIEEVAAQKKLIIGISELAAVGGTAVLLQSGAEQLQLAKMTANNAVVNNFLNHTKPSLLGLSEKEQYDSAAAACGPSDPAACRQATELAQVSRERDQQLQQACGAGPTKQCAFFQNQARAMGNNVYQDGNFVWANSPDVGFGLNVSTVSAPGANPALTNSWHHQVSQSTSEGLALGTGVGTLVATPGAAVRVGTGVVRGVRAGSQAVAHAATAEAQLLQFGYYHWAVPAIPGVLPIVNNPQNVQNAADFVLGGWGLDPNAPNSVWGRAGWAVNEFVRQPLNRGLQK